MRKLVFILLIVITTAVYSQTEVPKDSFPPLKKETLNLDEKLDNYLRFDSQTGASSFSTVNTPNYQPLQKEELKMSNIYIPPLDVYVGPPLENNSFTSYPFANDYSFYSGYPISDQTWLTSSSIQSGYPTLGAVRSVNLNFNYQPADWLVISAGPYGAKYNLYGNQYNDVGVNGAVKFILHDRIRLNGYGQYSVNSDRNRVQGPMMGMYPQTFYGGTIEVKLTNKFGIEGGVIRELNPFNGKWVNRPYFAPVFYTK